MDKYRKVVEGISEVIESDRKPRNKVAMIVGYLNRKVLNVRDASLEEEYKAIKEEGKTPKDIIKEGWE